ncbi:GrlR family regulatory protein [Pseudomonas bubulae]|uniref:GrlR family regulatory protein n=1 Tax=Pseudomonas bubulae TaxID=2316085 RepID=UPI003BB68446
MNGSDAHFMYQGKIPIQSGEFTALINVTPWQSGNTHVFGGTGSYVLETHGSIDYEKGIFSLHGSPQGNSQLKLQATGKKIGEVA